MIHNFIQPEKLRSTIEIAVNGDDSTAKGLIELFQAFASCESMSDVRSLAHAMQSQAFLWTTEASEAFAKLVPNPIIPDAEIEADEAFERFSRFANIVESKEVWELVGALVSDSRIPFEIQDKILKFAAENSLISSEQASEICFVTGRNPENICLDLSSRSENLDIRKVNTPEFIDLLCAAYTHPDCPEELKGKIWDEFNDNNVAYIFDPDQLRLFWKNQNKDDGKDQRDAKPNPEDFTSSLQALHLGGQE